MKAGMPSRPTAKALSVPMATPAASTAADRERQAASACESELREQHPAEGRHRADRQVDARR